MYDSQSYRIAHTYMYSLQGLNEKVTKLLATRRTRTRRRTSSPSVHSSKWAQAWSRAAPIFKRHVKRPTGCRVLCSLSLLGAPARTPRGAARWQQHERARCWHLQPASRLQSSSHAIGGCHWCTHSRHGRRFAPRGSLGTRPSPRRRRARRLRGGHRQSTRSWFVVEYVTSALYYIDTMLGLGPRAKGTGCVALAERSGEADSVMNE